MKIEKIDIERVIPYARNPRKNAGAVDKVAASLREFGFRQPIVVDENYTVIVGHTRLLAAKKLGMSEVPVHIAQGLSDAQVQAYRIADNRTNEEAEWDIDLLKVEFKDLQDQGADLAMTAFDEDELKKFLAEPVDGLTDPDATPELPLNPKSQLGDIWICGQHRVMCGDSTSISDVERLMTENKAALLHADPPYGMGKEAEGVANDNLYAENLDRFQMEWWATFRTFLNDNASAYIWGNAPDLWRLWYVGGLGKSEQLQLQNEIVWSKPSGFGQSSGEMRSFAVNTERCLFFLLGAQGYNNNADNYWIGWDSLRNYLVEEKQKSGLTNEEIKAVTNTSHSHYWTTSQWAFPTKEHYQAIQRLAKCNAFKREYDDLKREFYETRAYFDNSHENMNEVWEFPRVLANDRHGHATPKPVAMMERIMKSSLPHGGLCVEPFGGSGSTLIGAEKTNRICYIMELQPKYVDVIVKRWQDFTGKEAVLESNGKKFNEIS